MTTSARAVVGHVEALPPRGVLIVALSGAATATVALNKITTLADEVFPTLNHITAPKGLVTPEYEGGPQTFLILGSDRRVRSKDTYDREDPPHSDTILLVRFDPEQGQTSVLSIPRDLMVNITTPSGQVYAERKDQRRVHDRQQARRHQRREPARGGNDQARSLPGTEAQRHRRRELRGLHQSRRHARLRLRERRPPLLQRERRHDGNGLHEHQPAARLPEALLRKRARLRALPPHRLGLRARRPPAGLPARPARADQSRPTSSARSTRWPERSGTRSARPSPRRRAS